MKQSNIHSISILDTSLVFLSCLFICLLPGIKAQEGDRADITKIAIETILAKTEIRCAEPFEFQVVLTWKGQPDDFKIEPLKELDLSELEQLKSSVSNQTSGQGDLYSVKRVYRYTLLPRKEGQTRIGSISVFYRQRDEKSENGYSEKRTLVTAPISVSVLPPPEKLNMPWRALGSLFGLVLFISLFIFILKRKKRDERPGDAQVNKTLYNIFRERVKSEEHLIIEGDVKEYFIRMERALSQYLYEVTGHQIHGLQADQIVDLLAETISSEEEQKVLGNFFKTTNLIKFANQHPEQEEIERMTRAILRLVDRINTSEEKKTKEKDST